MFRKLTAALLIRACSYGSRVGHRGRRGHSLEDALIDAGESPSRHREDGQNGIGGGRCPSVPWITLPRTSRRLRDPENDVRRRFHHRRKTYNPAQVHFERELDDQTGISLHLPKVKDIWKR
jgi:hypothetical protein